MDTTFPAPARLSYNRGPAPISSSGAKPFALAQAHSKPALGLLVCLVLVIGLYGALPWLFPAPRSSQLIGRWQLQAQIRNGSRVPISGVYEFRSDYTTRSLAGTSGTRAGLWIIRAPAEGVASPSPIALANTTIITSTYQFIDTLTHHISVQVNERQGAPDDTLWPGPGIYDIIMIDNNQLTLRIPDTKAGGWIVLECTKMPEASLFDR